jgi:hypothetical protein
MPMLALGSAPQLQHLVDLESWRGDRFDASRAGAWIALLLEAGEPAVKRMLKNADDEFLALLVGRWIRVEQLQYEDTAEVHGHGHGDAGTEKGWSTPDGYHRFNPVIPEHAPAIQRFLHLFYREFPDRYQRALWTALWDLPSETEEQALRWRRSRLEEHGFPPWDEALDVYAPAAGEAAHPEPLEPADRDGLAAPRVLVATVPTREITTAIDALPPESRERVLHEFVSLANRLLVADRADAGDPSAHRGALRKAAGYLSIALRDRAANDPSRIGSTLERMPLVELFREGHGKAVDLQGRARRLSHDGWASTHADSLELLDFPIRQRVEGLLQPRPKYFELDEQRGVGELRDFESHEELDETRAALGMAEIVGSLLVDRLGFDPRDALGGVPPGGASSLKLSGAFLTALAWHATDGRLATEPLPPAVVADFLRDVASRRTADPEAGAGALDGLVRTVVERFSLDPRQAPVLTAFGRYCLEQLVEECGGLDPSVPPDPRYVTCLRLTPE